MSRVRTSVFRGSPTGRVLPGDADADRRGSRAGVGARNLKRWLVFTMQSAFRCFSLPRDGKARLIGSSLHTRRTTRVNSCAASPPCDGAAPTLGRVFARSFACETPRVSWTTRRERETASETRSYPCEHCADDFREEIRKEPPRFVPPRDRRAKSAPLFPNSHKSVSPAQPRLAYRLLPLDAAFPRTLPRSFSPHARCVSRPPSEARLSV